MPFLRSERQSNEERFAQFCQLEADRQQALFIARRQYDQVARRPLSQSLEVEVHVYQGLRGRGFVMIGTENRDGEIWERCVSVGPENREKAWYKTPRRADRAIRSR